MAFFLLLPTCLPNAHFRKMTEWFVHTGVFLQNEPLLKLLVRESISILITFKYTTRVQGKLNY